MSKKVKVTKIVLETEDQKVALTLEQAKDLYRELGELFGEKTVVVDRTPIWAKPHLPYYPYDPVIYGDSISAVATTSGLKVEYSGDEERSE